MWQTSRLLGGLPLYFIVMPRSLDLDNSGTSPTIVSEGYECEQWHHSMVLISNWGSEIGRSLAAHGYATYSRACLLRLLQCLSFLWITGTHSHQHNVW